MCAGNVEQGDISLKCTNQRANYDQHKCISNIESAIEAG